MTRGLAKVVAMTAALLCFASCAGSLFQSKAPPSSIYQLSPTPGAAAADTNGGAPVLAVDLAVLRPKLRPGLQSDRIAIVYPDRHLDYFADARWSGPLDQVVQDLTVRTFRSSAHLRNVAADSSAFTSAYWLELEVADFQAEYRASSSAPIIHVRLLARLGSARERRVIGSFEAEAREPAAENRLTAIVAAYEEATDDALLDLAMHASIALGEAIR